jgi:hypothetical protein
MTAAVPAWLTQVTEGQLTATEFELRAKTTRVRNASCRATSASSAEASAARPSEPRGRNAMGSLYAALAPPICASAHSLRCPDDSTAVKPLSPGHPSAYSARRRVVSIWDRCIAGISNPFPES